MEIPAAYKRMPEGSVKLAIPVSFRLLIIHHSWFNPLLTPRGIMSVTGAARLIAI
jgi:hypothetical protein